MFIKNKKKYIKYTFTTMKKIGYKIGNTYKRTDKKKLWWRISILLGIIGLSIISIVTKEWRYLGIGMICILTIMICKGAYEWRKIMNEPPSYQ